MKRNSKIIAILNAKGGVGKSTVAVNLAHALAKIDQKVLVVDIDPQSNASQTLLPRKSNPDHTLYELIESANGSSTEKCIYAAHDNLWVLPNVEDTAALEPDLIERKDFYAIQQKVRPYAKERFDFVFIDCPPTLGTWVITALYGADYAIIPINSRDRYSIDGLLRTVKIISTIRESKNPDLTFLKLLINQVHRRERICKFNIEQIQTYFDADKIFETVIPVNVNLADAVASRKTIFKEAPASRGCTAFRQLAKELLSLFDGEV